MRRAKILFLRTTRAVLNAERAAGNLNLAEPYVIIDETPMGLAIGTGEASYTDVTGGVGGGSSGLDVAFPAASLQWLINHNLGRTVEVVAFTTGSVRIGGVDVILLNNDQAVANFSTPTAGFARVI